MFFVKLSRQAVGKGEGIFLRRKSSNHKIMTAVCGSTNQRQALNRITASQLEVLCQIGLRLVQFLTGLTSK